MNCQETRQRLSALADEALPGAEVQAVHGHLAGCPSCRRELDAQGELDMLLKSRFMMEPPESFFASFWPLVAEKIDGAPGSEARPPLGGSAAPAAGEIVFKSSSAMQMLNIPERRPPPASVQATASTHTPLPPEAQHLWRWPLAFIAATAISVGGFVYYKRSIAPPAEERGGLPGETAKLSGASGGGGEPTTSATRQDAALQVAMAAPGEAAGGQDAGAAPSAEPEAKKTAVAAGGKARKAKAGKGGQDEAGDAPVAEPKPAARAKGEAKPEAAAKGGKKKDDLDNLIDSAIGSDGPKPKKVAKAAPDPGSDLAEQLTMNQIQSAMSKIKGLVGACYDQYQVEGLAKVTFTINGDGGIKDAAIKGKFFGTDTGLCVVNAVKKARFPKFKGKSMTIKEFPFQLQ